MVPSLLHVTTIEGSPPRADDPHDHGHGHGSIITDTNSDTKRGNDNGSTYGHGTSSSNSRPAIYIPSFPRNLRSLVINHPLRISRIVTPHSLVGVTFIPTHGDHGTELHPSYSAAARASIPEPLTRSGSGSSGGNGNGAMVTGHLLECESLSFGLAVATRANSQYDAWSYMVQSAGASLLSLHGVDEPVDHLLYIHEHVPHLRSLSLTCTTRAALDALVSILGERFTSLHHLVVHVHLPSSSNTNTNSNSNSGGGVEKKKKPNNDDYDEWENLRSLVHLKSFTLTTAPAGSRSSSLAQPWPLPTYPSALVDAIQYLSTLTTPNSVGPSSLSSSPADDTNNVSSSSSDAASSSSSRGVGTVAPSPSLVMVNNSPVAQWIAVAKARINQAKKAE